MVEVAGASDGLPSARLRSQYSSGWTGLLCHPFVREMAAGALALEKFRFYVEQNILYLHEYAKAIALGAAKSRSRALLGRFSGSLQQIVDTELDQNQALLDRVIELGAIDRGGSSGLTPAALAYTSYLKSVAFEGEPVETLAVILPCAWSYREICLQYPEPAEHPLYPDWIEFFRSATYGAYIDHLLMDFNDLAARVDEDTELRLSAHFLAGIRLEHQFWDMGYGLLHWPDVMMGRSR